MMLHVLINHLVCCVVHLLIFLMEKWEQHIIGVANTQMNKRVTGMRGLPAWRETHTSMAFA